MKALDLIEESNEILQLPDGHPGVRLVGQSKEEARRLLNNVNTVANAKPISLVYMLSSNFILAYKLIFR